MFKNVASQSIQLFAFIPSTGLPKTGDAANITAYVSKDHGTVTALTDTTAAEMDATNAKGVYVFTLTQAETNADELTFTAKSATADVAIVPRFVTTLPTTGILAPATAGRTLNVDTTGAVKIQSGLKKNQALAKFTFLMTDSTNHNPAPGLTVSGAARQDAGASAALAASVVEVANGIYSVDLSAAEMNGNTVTLRFTATGADDLVITLITEP